MENDSSDYAGPYIFDRYLEFNEKNSSFILAKPFFCYNHCLKSGPISQTVFSGADIIPGIADAYGTKLGKKLAENDSSKGFTPNIDILRLGEGIPISPLDIDGYHILVPEYQKQKINRIFGSLQSLNSMMRFLYSRCKLDVLNLQKSGMNLYDQIVQIYHLLIAQLDMVSHIPEKWFSKHMFVRHSFETCIRTLEANSNLYADNESLTYAYVFNMHRLAFSGHIDHLAIYTDIGFVDPTFVSLAGQETWMIMHYLSPDLRRLHSYTITRTIYDTFFKVDLYDYCNGEIFVRDIYRAEHLIHDMFCASLKIKGISLADILIRIINASDFSKIESGVGASSIAQELISDLNVHKSNQPCFYFWIFDLINFPYNFDADK